MTSPKHKVKIDGINPAKYKVEKRAGLNDTTEIQSKKVCHVASQINNRAPRNDVHFHFDLALQYFSKNLSRISFDRLGSRECLEILVFSIVDINKTTPTWIKQKYFRGNFSLLH